MDWRVLVLIVSLLLNGYLFSSLRRLDFQAQELTRSATRQRRDLAAIANQLDQSIAASTRANTGISEEQMNEMITTMAKSEMDNRRPDCGALSARNSQRLKALQVRFRTFASSFETIVKKSAGTEISNPNRIQELAAHLKSEVLAQCKR